MHDDMKTVELGSRVRFGGRDIEEEYRIVQHDEADMTRRSISEKCPVGQALLGRRLGDRVHVRGPGGTWTLTILDID
jgi:transcription elongation factor GreA